MATRTALRPKIVASQDEDIDYSAAQPHTLSSFVTYKGSKENLPWPTVPSSWDSGLDSKSSKDSFSELQSDFSNKNVQAQTFISLTASIEAFASALNHSQQCTGAQEQVI